MNQPFFSIMNAAIYMVLGLVFGMIAASGNNVLLGNLELLPQASWGLCAVTFIMAYFSLVHLKTGNR